QYSYDSRNTGFERWLGATRGETRLGDKLTVGATYAGEFDERGTWKGTDEAPSPLRHHAYGLDASLQLAEQTEIHASYALSDTGSWGQGDNNSALQVGLSSRSVERLRLDGDYQRLERKFDPITNRFLVGQRDKERWNAKAEIDVSSEVVARAENRASRDISEGSDGERLTDMSQVLGATWNKETYPTLDAEFEVRDIYDGPDRSVQNDRRSTGRLTASHGWGRLDWRARYENERYDEKVRVNGEHETIHRLKAEPKLYLGQGLTIGGEGKVETHFDRETDRYDERRSFLKGRAEYQVSKTFSALGAWERRDTHDTDRQGFSLGGGVHRDSDLGYSLGANWKPTHNFETRSRVERQRGRDELLNEDNRRTQSYRQQAFWYISRDFEVSGEFIHTDLEDLRKIGVSGDGDRRIDNEFLADVSYNHKEDLSLTAGAHFHKRDLYTSIVSETWVRRVFLGGNIHLTRRLELTGEGYYAWLEGEPLAYEEEGREIENARLRFLLELAYDFKSHTRFAFGVEGVDYEEDSAPENANDFSATRAYLKLIGRF
ncbi:MAG: hypothetical protein HKN21_00305, partial [Candidatus Eisenbacteria bacterium]|nr:hypothetical protein [Candidatus Eisenbacteria bacterium]